MLYKIARKLSTDYLDTLSFADRTGGLVRVMKDSRKGERRYPVEINQDKELGDKQYLRSMVVDSNLKSLMYWEQSGSPTVIAHHNSRYEVEANLKLVCWFNYQKVDPDMYDPTFMIAEIVSAIPFSIGNFQCLAAVTCEFVGQDPNDGSIFSEYTYNEAESQFFTYPYDYFVLNFTVNYWVVRDCEDEGIDEITIDPVRLVINGDNDRVVQVSGVSGREYELYIYEPGVGDIVTRTLHEYSGELQEYEIDYPAGDIYFEISYGREYLKEIVCVNEQVSAIVIPDDDNIRLEYVDLSDNSISATYLNALIDHIYDTEVNDGTLDIGGGLNAAIIDVTALAQINTLVNDRNWTITHN